MSGDQIASAIGGRGFVPRVKKRRRTLLEVNASSTPTSYSSPNGPPVPAGSNSANQSAPTLISFSAHALPSSATSPVTKVAATQPAAIQVDRWKHLSEKELWTYFVQIRNLYHQANPQPAPTAALSLRYILIREYLFNLYMPDVVSSVSSYKFKKMPASTLIDPEDLLKDCLHAHWESIDKYDPSFGDGNVTYMGYFNSGRLQGSMTDGIRRLQEFPRPIAEARRKLKPLFSALVQKLGHEFTWEEFLDEYGWETGIFIAKKFLTYRTIITNPLFYAGVFNQSQLPGGESSGSSDDESGWESSILQLCEARPEQLDRRLSRMESMEKILAVIIDPEIRYIMFSYVYTQATHKTVAKELTKAYGKYRSQSWVAQKHKEGEQILRAAYNREEMKEIFQL